MRRFMCQNFVNLKCDLVQLRFALPSRAVDRISRGPGAGNYGSYCATPAFSRLSPGFLPAFPRLSPGCTMECRGVSKSEVRHGSKDSYGEAININ